MTRCKLSALTLAFTIILMIIFSVGTAASYDDEPVIRSSTAILYEVNSGEIIYQKNQKQKAYPASTTKVMTALLALENCTMDEPVTVTKAALNTVTAGSSIAGLQNGEVLTMYEMLECLLVASGNDAANVIAVHIGGTLSNFVDMMNERSKELGCTGSYYTNPSGLHDEKHYTTVEDLLKVTLEAVKFAEFREIVGSAQVSIPPTNKVNKTRYFNNTNQLLSQSVSSENLYSKATGIKTGHTTPAGYCLVSSAEDKDKSFICVVLGGYIDEKNGRNYSYVDTINLYLWGFAKFGYKTVVNETGIVTEIEVNLAKDKDYVILRAANDVTAFVHNKENIDEHFTKAVSLQENITAPVEKGAVLGSMTIFKDGKVFARVDLVAANTVERSEGLFYIEESKTFFKNPIVQTIIAVFIVFIIFYIIFTVIYNKRRRNIARKKHKRGLD